MRQARHLDRNPCQRQHHAILRSLQGARLRSYRLHCLGNDHTMTPPKRTVHRGRLVKPHNVITELEGIDAAIIENG
jgi:hypothetical protein